jgi:hypothetical protein
MVEGFENIEVKELEEVVELVKEIKRGEKNKQLNNAKRNKQDEFYTQLSDIEKELKYYKDHFKGKIVFCNCDDPQESNFWKYFYLKFDHLGLKKVISTHYDHEKPTYKLEYDGKNIIRTDLKENGDFRSPECIELLKESDIIVTNPPFSLFREYVSQLIEYNKNFIIIGSLNAIKYKDIFPLIQKNKMWVGYNNGEKEFVVPDYYEPKELRYREENGIKYRSMGNVYWYTNLDIKKRHEDLILYKKYNKEEYPKYDNYNAINVNRFKDIPIEYNDMMGVPITFMDRYNPHQFEIIAHHGCPYINGKGLYSRIIIKRRVK